MKIRTYTVQGHPRSSILASIESACSFLLIINSNVGRTSYSCRDIDALTFKIAYFHTPPLLNAAQRRNALQYQYNLYIAEKYIQWATILSHSCSRDIIVVQGHLRSSILVSIESPRATSYQSLIVTLAVSPTVFEILTFNTRTWLVFHTISFSRSRLGEPLRISV